MVDVLAPMVATVLSVPTKVGAAVAEGEPLLVVESMKMEIPLPAPVAGVVRELHVSERDLISEGDVLVRIEPST